MVSKQFHEVFHHKTLFLGSPNHHSKLDSPVPFQEIPKEKLLRVRALVEAEAGGTGTKGRHHQTTKDLVTNGTLSTPMWNLHHLFCLNLTIAIDEMMQWCNLFGWRHWDMAPGRGRIGNLATKLQDNESYVIHVNQLRKHHPVASRWLEHRSMLVLYPEGSPIKTNRSAARSVCRRTGIPRTTHCWRSPGGAASWRNSRVAPSDLVATVDLSRDIETGRNKIRTKKWINSLGQVVLFFCPTFRMGYSQLLAEATLAPSIWPAQSVYLNESIPDTSLKKKVDTRHPADNLLVKPVVRLLIPHKISAGPVVETA